MTPEIHMQAPICLIENTGEKLVANQEALEILSAHKNPLVVVAIVGLYRTGKSYLMNKLAEKNNGFSIGTTVQSHTKGIWMWCVPHPKKPDHTLVLLDTEGLGDVEKGDKKNDTQIFALAILLSSTFVYNTMNKIDQRAIDLLHYVTELSNHLRKASSPDLEGVEDATNLESFCPDFVWTLRDFYLTLEVDGQLIIPDEYLENSLKLNQGTNQSVQNFNLPRLCIKEFFPMRKCFIFDSPTHRKKLAQLETLPNDELDPEFVEQVAEFCSYIFNHSKTKTLPGGIKVDGPRLKSLLLTYVNAISRGDMPCMENSFLALAQIKNSAAVKKAAAHYDQQMGQKVQLPTETLQELLDLHRESERQAIEVFMKNSFKDTDQKFQKELETLLEAKKDDLYKKNMDESTNRCSALLRALFGPLENEVRQGIYSKPGGHHLFIQKTEMLKARYNCEPRKGIQAEKVLQEYLQSRQSTSDAILQTDQALTKRQKEMEEARIKAEAAKTEALRLEAIQRCNQQRMEERERLHQEQVRQMQILRENQLQEQQRALERRLQEEAEKLNKEIEAQQRRLQNEIQDLQRNAASRGNQDDICILL